ncbi:glycerophosphodiester phosphodiesterase 1 [Fusarium sp. NRRL 52700]|nr:glycerophosphodiester phosphodiesterase 1 [Fusarium sp. NRRL 52700]
MSGISFDLSQKRDEMDPAEVNYSEYIADPHRQCAIVAHRGLWTETPENSLLSIRRAIKAGHNIVEIDACQVLTLEELISLPPRNRDGGPESPFTDEKVPSLRDVFELTRDRIYIHLDIKHRHVIPEVLAYAQKMGVEKQVDFWADLKTEDDLAWIKANMTIHGVALIALTHFEHDDWREQAKLALELKPLICEASFRGISQVGAMKQHFHDAGISLWVNNLNSVSSPGFTDSAALEGPDAVWGRLLRAGFSAIQTDEKTALRSFLNTLN